MKNHSKRQFEEKMSQLDVRADCLRSIARLYEVLKREELIQWIDENPIYWEVIYSLNSEDITKDLAILVMNSLKKSHILELQLLWIFKCSDYLDIAGNPI